MCGKTPSWDADGGKEKNWIVGRGQKLPLSTRRKHPSEKFRVGFVLLVADADETVDEPKLQLVKSSGVPAERSGKVRGHGHFELQGLAAAGDVVGLGPMDPRNRPREHDREAERRKRFFRLDLPRRLGTTQRRGSTKAPSARKSGTQSGRHRRKTCSTQRVRTVQARLAAHAKTSLSAPFFFHST